MYSSPDVRGSADSISKHDFLVMILENFKPCMIYSTKFRVCPTFIQFFETEAHRYTILDLTMKKDHSQLFQSSKLRSEEGTKDRSTTPQVKVRASRAESVSNKSSNGDLQSLSYLEKKTGL